MSEVRTIDPAAVADLAGRLDRAADELERRNRAVGAALRSVGRSNPVDAPLGSVISGATRRAVDLRSRLAEIQRLEFLMQRMGEPGHAFPLPSTLFPTAAAAEEAARALADRIKAEEVYGDIDDLLVELTPHVRDVAYVKAFYDRLGPEDTVLLLAEVLDRDPTAGVYPSIRWVPVAQSLGTAFEHDVFDAQEFGWIMNVCSAAQLRDVIAMNDLPAELVVRIGVIALDKMPNFGWMDGDYPGLMDHLAADPRVAARVLAQVQERTLASMLGGDFEFYDGTDQLLDAALDTLPLFDPAESARVMERLVRTVALGDTRLSDPVQEALARGAGTHLEEITDWAAGTAFGGNAIDLPAAELGDFLARVMKDNDEAFATLHGAAAVFAAQQLAQPGGAEAASMQTERLGVLYGLLALSHASLKLDAAKSSASLLAVGTTALGLIPTPAGLAAKVTAIALKAAAKQWATQKAAADSSDAAAEAQEIVADARGYGRLLIAGALWEADRERPGAGQPSPLEPPPSLLGADGHLLPLAELLSPEHRRALAEWVDREAVREAVHTVDGTYTNAFNEMFPTSVR